MTFCIIIWEAWISVPYAVTNGTQNLDIKLINRMCEICMAQIWRVHLTNVLKKTCSAETSSGLEGYGAVYSLDRLIFTIDASVNSLRAWITRGHVGCNQRTHFRCCCNRPGQRRTFWSDSCCVSCIVYYSNAITEFSPYLRKMHLLV